MSEETPRVERDRKLILDAKQEGTGAKLWVYTKLSGPGWIQSAITLGGGSLAGSLYLGVLAGFGLMWLQPLAMILGVVMLMITDEKIWHYITFLLAVGLVVIQMVSDKHKQERD